MRILLRGFLHYGKCPPLRGRTFARLLRLLSEALEWTDSNDNVFPVALPGDGTHIRSLAASFTKARFEDRGRLVRISHRVENQLPRERDRKSTRLNSSHV